ncbi:LapA family protein [Sporosalibacterium faouarense]|uniref:LapA family protein n=1 Tax=Sporosalibacterium faouarense TaxID=516123 RepID=UPI00141CDB00|nr:LapA family protein [Sporosalibacterium faouarense]MTI47839.1 LapA family protein [Bacillota bacterium]
MDYRFILSLILAIIVAIFAIQNSSAVDINFLFANFNISQALVILVSALLGAIVVMFLGIVQRMKVNKKYKNVAKIVEKLEVENNKLMAKNQELISKLEEGHTSEANNKEEETPEIQG